jgi:hypothetical protein
MKKYAVEAEMPWGLWEVVSSYDDLLEAMVAALECRKAQVRDSDTGLVIVGAEDRTRESN